jgi:hypothetical protein
MSPQPPNTPPRKPPARYFGYILMVVLAVGFLIYAGWAVTASWGLAGGIQMSANGWIALTLAFVVTAGLGGGLMWLAFYSARKGYDDNVGSGDEPE